MKKTLKSYRNLSIFNLISDILMECVNEQCDFMYISGPGSSPSKVYLFKDKKDRMYAVKICDNKISRVKIKTEYENRKKLLPYLNGHLTEILGIYEINNFEIMISECKGIDSLYTSIISNKKSMDFHLKIWKKVLNEVIAMWSKSKNPSYNLELNPRNNSNRIERIKNGLLNTKYKNYLLKDLWDKVIIINGEEYFSLSEAFNLINTIGCPSFGVTCHGDPQPSNIIIDNTENWYFVDWEWSGENHDYRMMFSHLFGWWNTRMTYLKKDSTFVVLTDKININYEFLNNPIIEQFQIEAEKIFNKYFKISKKDAYDINCFLALLYLGDVRFLSIWDKEDYLPILIGEAIKTLNYNKTKNNSKVNSSFTFLNIGEK